MEPTPQINAEVQNHGQHLSVSSVLGNTRYKQKDTSHTHEVTNIAVQMKLNISLENLITYFLFSVVSEAATFTTAWHKTKFSTTESSVESEAGS